MCWSLENWALDSIDKFICFQTKVNQSKRDVGPPLSVGPPYNRT